MNSTKRFVDVSHTIEDGLITYRGLPAPVVCDYLTREESRQHYSEGTEFHIGKIEMVANTGTYLDSPFHRYEDERDVSELELSSLACLDGVVVKSPRTFERALDRALFDGLELKGKAVLVHTGWDVHWKTDKYFDGHPFLTEGAARLLADAGARLVGIDSYNIDDTNDGRRPAHSLLLGAGIVIVEHLCHLELLPSSGFSFFAVPVKVKRMGTFPVRAFAVVNE